VRVSASQLVAFRLRPRGARGKKGGSFTGFLPAISAEALKAKGDRLRELRIHRHTNLSLNDLAEWLNPIIAGWMNYYGRYYRAALTPLLRRVSIYLRRWAGKEYKRLRSYKRFNAVVGRATRTRARPVRPLAVGPRVLKAGQKSWETGDCHAQIRGSVRRRRRGRACV
jgi:Group II intron, maturase-specific domain